MIYLIGSGAFDPWGESDDLLGISPIAYATTREAAESFGLDYARAELSKYPHWRISEHSWQPAEDGWSKLVVVVSRDDGSFYDQDYLYLAPVPFATSVIKQEE